MKNNKAIVSLIFASLILRTAFNSSESQPMVSINAGNQTNITVIQERVEPVTLSDARVSKTKKKPRH
jgi:hypothetical protein